MKTKDIVAVVGEYQSGETTKKIFRNVGELHTKEDGTQFILLDKIFNPAALTMPGKDKIVLNLYEPRDKTDTQTNQQPKTEQTETKIQTPPASKPAYDESMNDDLPF